MHVLPADPPRALGPIPGDAVPGLGEAAELLNVLVEQLTRTRPLIANDRRPWGRLGTRAGTSAYDLVDGRVRPTDLDGDRPRTPARPPAQVADAALLPGGHPPRRVVRPAGTIGQTSQRPAVLRAGLAPSPHPLPDRGLRDVRPGRGLGERLTVINDAANDQLAATRREPGSMVR